MSREYWDVGGGSFSRIDHDWVMDHADKECEVCGRFWSVHPVIVIGPDRDDRMIKCMAEYRGEVIGD